MKSEICKVSTDKWEMTMIEPLSEELKDAIIREHPDGLWLVLAEEYSSDQATATDFFPADGCTGGGRHQNS
jgi:hypothetical protein